MAQTTLPRLELGPIVGAVGPRNARIWACLSDPGACRCRVWHHQAGASEVRGSPFTAATASAADRTVNFHVALPIADTTYRYDLEDDAGHSMLPADQPVPTFRNAPRRTAPDSFRFGLISCNRMTDANREAGGAMWNRMAHTFFERDVRFLFAVGDQVYADQAYDAALRRPLAPEAIAERYRRAYHRHWSHEAINRVFSNFPTLMIWDDHEIRNGWGSGPQDTHARQQRIFAEARRVYGEFQHAHNPETPPGTFHYHYRFGDVGFFVFDLRGKRDVTRARQPLLGRAQWDAFRAWLRDEVPTLRAVFLVSSVPVVHIDRFLADVGRPISDIRDHWTSPPNNREQEQLLEMLFETAQRHGVPVVILGGDVHVGTVACINSCHDEHCALPRIYQLTSSPISNRPAPGLARRFLPDNIDLDGGYEAQMLKRFGTRNFGIVELTRREDGPGYLISLELHHEGDAKPYRYSIG